MGIQTHHARRFGRRLLATAAAAGLALAGLLASSVPASAGTLEQHGQVVKQCSGIKKNTYAVAGTTATIQYWYSTNNGGTACAMLYDNKAGATNLQLNIATSSVYSHDHGIYEYYAGGVQLTNMRGKCVGIAANVYNRAGDKVLGYRHVRVCN